MPELPEVETVCRALTPILLRRRIANAFVGRNDLRWPLPKNLAASLKGRCFSAVDRRGKYVLMRLDNDCVLLLHLGMSGSVRIHDTRPVLSRHDHIMLTMVNVEDDVHTSARHKYVVLNDPRRFGWVDLFPVADICKHRLLANMGPEPLGNQFSALHIETVFKGRQCPVKSALLNQKLIAGIGNIYASEALFHAGISPRRRAKTIVGQRAVYLASAIVKTLRMAIEYGGTSLRDHVQPSGEIGYFIQHLSVYNRAGQPCHTCKTPIKVISQASRSSFYCPRCQR